MTTFRDTQAAEFFIASADSRETSPEIMQAIAFFARTLAEAEALWNGDGFGSVCSISDLWERVTGNGRRDADEFMWGAAGSRWWDDLQVMTIDARVEGGDTAEDYDTGTVIDVAGDEITVAWDNSKQRTTQPSSVLRPEGSNPH